MNLQELSILIDEAKSKASSENIPVRVFFDGEADGYDDVIITKLRHRPENDRDEEHIAISVETTYYD